MRERVDEARLRRFLAAFGRAAADETRVYLAGGATAVLLGWRTSTIDVDLRLDPERDELLRAIPGLKDELRVNVELASPADFIPMPRGWEERSIFVAREGRASFFHLDPYSQALAKLERAHRQDLEDVRSLLAAGLVEPGRLLELFAEIEPELYRFPAVDPASFRRRVEELAGR